MALEKMYKGIPFSPTATLTANISATDTIIPVSDVDAFPDAPSLATIGSIAGPNETIIYTGKTTTSLTGCTRGVEGTASDWAVDELIGRNFTAKDHADIIKNIEELENNKLDATYKVDVVNTADITAAGKALDARQNNPNITGTLAQKILANTQGIGFLKSVTRLDDGLDILAVVTSTAFCPLGETRTFRIFNSLTSPYKNNDNDFIYEIRVGYSGYATLKAIDVRSNRVFNNSLVLNVWTGWEEDARMNKLGELFKAPVVKKNESLAQVLTGNYYRFLNATAGIPNGYVSGDNDFLLIVLTFEDITFQRHLLLDARSNRVFVNATCGVSTFREWREI